MTDTIETVEAKVLKTFRDEGTTKTYTKDDDVSLTKGEFANFEAAGLVEAKGAATDGDEKTSEAKTSGARK